MLFLSDTFDEVATALFSVVFKSFIFSIFKEVGKNRKETK
jgi:hypothetical protein